MKYGFGILALLVAVVSAVFLPIADAFLRRQGVSQVVAICENVARRSGKEEGFTREKVREQLLVRERASGVRVDVEGPVVTETYTFRIGIFPWGESHRAHVLVRYDADNHVHEIQPTFPTDL